MTCVVPCELYRPHDQTGPRVWLYRPRAVGAESWGHGEWRAWTCWDGKRSPIVTIVITEML